jgi:acyl-[acyl-carrier-protein] desaturase
MNPVSDGALLKALEPMVEASLARHCATAREWLPHELVPWGRGQDFAGDAGMPWAPDQSRLGEAAQAAFALNLLTEDNLPSYHHELVHRLGRNGPWGEWVRRWTAEEARHATSLRDYAHVSRAIDPVALERDRMATMQAGWAAGKKGLLRSLVYTSLQELATRVAHRNTGRAVQDPVAERLLSHIAADENLHMVFYRDVVNEALAISPEQGLIAIAAEVTRFVMPGTSVPRFLRWSVLIADAGIYDVRTHRDEVIMPLLKHWQALKLPLTTSSARQAQGELSKHLDRLSDMAERQEARRMLRAESRARTELPPTRT